MRAPVEFEAHNAALAHLPPSARCAIEAHRQDTGGDWRLIGLKSQIRLERELLPDPVLDYQRQPKPQPRPSRSTRPGRVRFDPGGDPLKTESVLRTYWEAEFGIVVPENGRVRCPSPAHEDLNPSCQIRKDGGWRCWSCNARGDAIDLAAIVKGIEPVGAGYWRLRDHLLDVLLRAPLRGARGQQ